MTQLEQLLRRYGILKHRYAENYQTGRFANTNKLKNAKYAYLFVNFRIGTVLAIVFSR
jgi:hypothetical protein